MRAVFNCLIALSFAVGAAGCAAKQKKTARITFELDPTSLSLSAAADPRLYPKTAEVLRHRLEGTVNSSDSFSIRSDGKGRFSVEVPAEIDLKALEKTLTTPGKLEWFHARNVRTGKGVERLYDVGEQTTYRGGPAFTFIRRGGGDDIRPGTPEYAKMIAGWGAPVLEAENLEEASADPYKESYIPSLKFTPSGARKVEAWSRAYQNRGSQLAAVFDGVVISIAPLRDGTILRDSAVIQGEFDKGYVMRLKEILNSGSLPAPLRVLTVEKP